MPTPQHTWETLSNPFRMNDTNSPIIGHVSGRSPDIKNIITGNQSAIILAGAPLIGKTTLIRYLKEMPQATAWSWRKEEGLTTLRNLVNLDQIYFVQIELAPKIPITQLSDLHQSFINECIHTLWQIHHPGQRASFSGVKGLHEMLRDMEQKYPEARYFVMLDSIERLLQTEVQIPSQAGSTAQTAQERAISLLNHSDIIHTLVDLIDEFTSFGVILSIESLPQPGMLHQFEHVSADLARFTTTTLQCFTWNDTAAFLAQRPEDFGEGWAQRFRKLGGKAIFTEPEQIWIREQAGTHLYLLQKLCFQMFQLKQTYASTMQGWSESSEDLQKALVEKVSSDISPFLARLWKRLQEVLEMSSAETKNNFAEFVSSLVQKRTDDEIPASIWAGMGAELHYILANEGLIRYDLLRPVYYPGVILRNYLLQQAQQVQQDAKIGIPTPRSYRLTINIPDHLPERLLLSELEYRLLKILLQQHPAKCNEEELMKGAWGTLIEKATFTQRMHHLRKKLRKHGQENDMIVNQYGGQYALNHTEWLCLE